MQHAPVGSRRVKALYGLGVAHQLQGATAKAREYLQEALKLAPDFAEARALLERLPPATQS
jgi:tetratricopeptide (TPR) repeat protein